MKLDKLKVLTDLVPHAILFLRTTAQPTVEDDYVAVQLSDALESALKALAGVSAETGASRLSHVTLVEIADRISDLVHTIPNMDGTDANDKLRRGLVDLATELRHHAAISLVGTGAVHLCGGAHIITAAKGCGAPLRYESTANGITYWCCPACGNSHWFPVETGAVPPPGETSFQSRVQPWMLACFGAEIASDVVERNHRFIEEALELVQASGCSRDEVLQLVAYVYDRPSGDIDQEVGGVMVTLSALCLARSMDMHAAGEVELARIWGAVEKIRAKQAAKLKHSPLPARHGEAPTGQKHAGVIVDIKLDPGTQESACQACMDDTAQITALREEIARLRATLPVHPGCAGCGWDLGTHSPQCPLPLHEQLNSERLAHQETRGTVAALQAEIARLTAERDVENRVGRNCTRLLSESTTTLTALRASVEQVTSEMREALFRSGNHPALGVPTEDVDRWLAALSGSAGRP